MSEATFVAHDEVKEKSDASYFFFLLRFAKPETAKILGALALLVGGGAVSARSAWQLGMLVENLKQAVRGEAAWNTLLGPGIAILVLELLSVGAIYWGRLGLANAASQTLLAIRRRLFERLDELPMSYFDRQPVGRTVARISFDVEGLEDFFSGTLARMLSAFISLAASLTAMLVTNAHIGLVLIVAVIPAIVGTFAFRGPVRYWNREFARRNSAINAQLNEFLNGIPVIRSFGVEKWSQQEFDRTVEDHLKAAVMTNFVNAWSRPVILILCQLPLLTLILWGGPQVIASAMTLGIFVAFKGYCDRVSRPIANIAQEIHTIQAAFASAERVATFLQESDESASLGPDGALSAAHLRGEIEFRSLTMGYAAEHPVLKDVNFRIPAGARIGLAGTTGSGKTTTVALLARLYEYQIGEILLDGLPLRQYSRASLRDRMGFVSQDVVIFKGNLRENLLCGQARTDEQIWQACTNTGLARILGRNGMDLDSELLDRGQNLSLGERQLVALTRILLRDPAILILDEATANIDPGFEALITEAIEKVMAGRTCILIAHRLGTLRNCQNILVFRGGRLIEQGDHQRLVELNGYYGSLIRGTRQDDTLPDQLPEDADPTAPKSPETNGPK